MNTVKNSLFGIMVFIPQFFICSLFLNLDNEAKILLFCFFCFLFAIFFFPKQLVLARSDFLLFLILFVPIGSALLVSHQIYAVVYFLLIFALFYFRCFSGDLFRNSVRFKSFFLRTFSFFVLVVALFGLYEYCSFRFFGKSLQPLIPYLLPPNTSSRVVGIYGQANFTALLMLTGLLVYFYLYLHDQQFESGFLRWLRYLPFSVVALVFFLTGSRSGFLAIFLTVPLLCWLVVRRRYLTQDRARRVQFLFLCGLLVVVYLVAFSMNYQLPKGLGRSMGAAGVPTESRFVLWTAAALMFGDHPWLGVGLENYKLLLPQYMNRAYDLLGFVEYEAMAYTNWAHNEFLQLTCEGGIVVLLALLAVMFCLFYPLLMFALGRRDFPPLKMYSHLFLLPFVIHSMFSWPLRYGALLILFFCFGTLLLSQYGGREIRFSSGWHLIARTLAFCGLVATLFSVSQEVRMGNLARTIKRDGAQSSFVEFERLVSRPYSVYPLMLTVIPHYVSAAVIDRDVAFGERILPYTRHITEIQGTHWQWFNLSLVYFLLDRRDDAMKAVTRAIDLFPTEETYWKLQHYLNMLKASEQTGRPVDDFLPLGPGQKPGDVKELFDFVDKVRIYN